MSKQNKGGMSKKLRQAVQHANEENPKSRSSNPPNTSSTEKNV
jgi:hypothetical protein